MSDLSNFCKAVLRLIEANPEDRPSWFSPHYGLCYNAICYDAEYKTKIYQELLTLFEGKTYPFNNEESDEYFNEHLDGQIFANHARLEFLYEHALSDQEEDEGQSLSDWIDETARIMGVSF